MPTSLRRPVLAFGLATVLVLALAVAAGAAVGPATQVSGASPFAGSSPGGAPCNGAPQTGLNYPNSEVEPWVDVNLADQDNLIGNWQQDRWSNGGANGNLSAFSTDGGSTWTIPPVSGVPNQGQAKFSRCTGGNASNGGDYERATDPWVSFSPNGVAHQAALGINDSNVDNAVLASRSTDKGANWQQPVVIKRDNKTNFFNDKETLTANQFDSDFVYATWQRIVAPNERSSARAGERAAAFRSVAWFARSSDNGQSYPVVKPVYDPGNFAQTIGNQIVVLPDEAGDNDGRADDLVMVFNLIRYVGANRNRGFTAAVIRSSDNGDTWSNPIAIDRMLTDGVRDPADGHAVRTGDLLPQIAVDSSDGDLYVVWQDDRFTGEEQVALSKSENGGRSWSPTQRVSKTPNNAQAFTPTVRTADDGNTVAVQYYDFRNDTGTPGSPLTTDTWIVRSTDDGASFTEDPSTVGASYDMTTAPDARGYFVGDYVGLDFASGGSAPGFKPFIGRAVPTGVPPTDIWAATASKNP